MLHASRFTIHASRFFRLYGPQHRARPSAQGVAPGCGMVAPLGLLSGKPLANIRRPSVPHIALVVRKLIASEQLAELFLEALRLVMLRLALDVSGHG